MNLCRVTALALLALHAPLSFAAWGIRVATVELVQMESSTRVGYESIVWIRQTGVGAWSGSPSCSTEWAYFNAKQNPHFTATVLTSRLSEKPLRVYVDDALPKLDGMCQIFNLQL